MGRIIVGGHRPSPEHRLGLGSANEKLDAAGIAESSDLPMPPPLSQVWQDCVANSAALAILATQIDQEAAARGVPFSAVLSMLAAGALPSRRWIYYLLRAMIGEIGQDGGGYICDAFDAVALKGFPCERDVRYSTDDATRDEPMTWLQDNGAIDQRYVKGARRIVSSGYARVLDVARALSAGHRVVWGTALDQAFVDLEAGQVWPGMRGPSIGGHAMILTGHRPTPGDPSRLQIRTRSSWGYWCDNGDAWMDEYAIASDAASDFWILETAPTPTYPLVNA